MVEKTGRNDPCPCGSGKKYKQCCIGKRGPIRKIKAKWVNRPEGVNLIQRNFGNLITGSPEFIPASNPEDSPPQQTLE